VEGSYQNIKVTTPVDLIMGEAILSGSGTHAFLTPMYSRVGFGYDIHRFAPGRKLFLGGVEIPCDRGLLGHSDADVLLHAVCDALLGAAALGDIGRHFPDSDPAYKDISSLQLLKNVVLLISKKGFVIENIDAMLIMESPKIAAYVDRMRQAIAGSLGLGMESVSVKATTQEGVGSIGHGEAAACHAVASVRVAARQGGNYGVSV
jgi:2-C-methyl-D-erythritol 2,4-cyclodiphosphate synthase